MKGNPKAVVRFLWDVGASDPLVESGVTHLFTLPLYSIIPLDSALTLAIPASQENLARVG